jgi:uncharacterized protein YndB with AHSA1/START domain
MPIDGVVVKRMLRARRERVFAAWTRPELMTRWLFPGTGWTVDVTSELEVGGRYRLEMLDPEGVRHLQFGVYREIVPVSRLVFTWNCPDLAVTDSVVTVELIDRGEQTELSLTHELPPDPRVRKGHEEGWNGCLGNLETFLERTPT